MGPSVSARRGHDPPGTVTDARLVRAPGRAAGGRAGNPSRGLPGHRNDVVHTPLRTATSSGGAGVDRLWTLEPEAVTRHRNHCGQHSSRCLQVIIGAGITSLIRQCLSAGSLEVTEETFGWPIPASRAMAAPATSDARVAAVGLATAARWWSRRRGAGRAGAQEGRRAGRRVHAPTGPRPAAGVSIRPPRSSSSTLVAHAVSVAMSLTPFRMLRPWPSL